MSQHRGADAASAAVGPPPGMRVRLSSNESPFGPSPAAVAAARDAAANVHRYPDDQSTDLRAAVADHEGVPFERVAAGTGSTALLMDLAVHACRPRDGRGARAVLAYDKSFVVYRLGARVVGAPYVEAPLSGGYRRDPQALLDLVDGDTGLVAVDNPANPTGQHLSGPDLQALVVGIPDHVTVVVDEAYHHFAAGRDGYATVFELDLSHPRLVVTRTFSKAYALAGLRVGYAVGPADLIAAIDAQRSRFNINAVAQAAAVAALADQDHLAGTVEGTATGYRRMVDGLREIGAAVVEGLGNFVLIELGRPAGDVVEAFAAHGVGVRPVAPYGLAEHIRVTVGTPVEVDAFLAAAADVLGREGREATRPG